MRDDYPKTPELDKIKVYKDTATTIGGFLDWLEENNLYLCNEYDNFDERTKEELIADFFNIDLKKVSAEKDAIYAWMQKNQERD